MSAAGQLGFDDLLTSAEADNRARKFERKAAHLPGTMAGALPFFRDLLNSHNAAMLAGDVDETMRLRGEAKDLARKLDADDRGILAHDDAPGCLLERETAAETGSVPIWGQMGEFVITVNAMQVRIQVEGVFGIGSGFTFWPGFSAHAFDLRRPFLSQTGYRSFLGFHADPLPGITPDDFVARVIAAYVDSELKGRLLEIEPRIRERKEGEP